MRALLMMALLFVAGCRGCSQPPQTKEHRESLDAGSDPYGRLRAILGVRQLRHWSGCAGSTADCLDDAVLPAGVGPDPSLSVEVPFEEPLVAMSSEEAKVLATKAPELETIAATMKSIDPLRRREEALALQHDAWTAFDALFSVDGAERARNAMSAIIGMLALPRAELAKLGPSFADVVGAHADLFVGTDFVEIVAHESEPIDGDGPPSAVTRHARMRGERSVFRRFVRVPGGPSAVADLVRDAPPMIRLPNGSVVVVIEEPLAIAREKELVATAMVTLVEVRRIVPLPTEPKIRDLGFDVLRGPTLERVPPGAPFPSLGSCSLSDRLVPMRKSCVTCHQRRGDEVRSFGHGSASFHLAGEGEAAEAVLREKQGQKAFTALVAPLATSPAR